MAQLKPMRDQVPEDSLAAYLEEIGRSPLLTAEEEVTLAKRIEAGRDAAAEIETGVADQRRRKLEAIVADGIRARNHFLESNVRLVVSIAKRYRSGLSGVDFVDLIQEGNLGLMRAVDKFEWRKGFKFSTYATWWIRQAISRAMQEKGRTIRLPPKVHDAALKVKSVAAQLQAENGRTPSVHELMERTGLEERRIEEVMKIGEMSYLESPIGEDGAVLGDFIVTDEEPGPDHAVLDSDRSKRLQAAIARLSEREQVILRHRFGLTDGDPHTRVEIGEILGLTAERIGQIERAALCKVRHPAFGLLEKDFE